MRLVRPRAVRRAMRPRSRCRAARGHDRHAGSARPLRPHGPLEEPIMLSKSERVLLAILSAAVLSLARPTPAIAADGVPPVNGTVALHGYDAVAYHTDGRPVQGTRQFEFAYKGAIFRFASQANRDAFAANPEKYAPQYGGYCAYAVSQGYTADTDPEAFSIVGGKLYLNYSKAVKRRWDRDQQGYIARADANWPKLVRQ
jgi:YHS domain-containing protein